MNSVHPLRPNSRVLIVEDHVLFAESLELALTLEGYDARRLPLPSHTGASGQLLATALRLRPRIVLLDLDLGSFGDGVRFIRPLASAGANVVVVTASADFSRRGECLWHGARKTMAKTQPLNEILSVVRRLYQGLPVADSAERERLLAQWEEHRHSVEEQRRRLDTLTPREREVLARLREGTPVRDIARLSVVSEATVRTQVKSILAKLGVTSQLAAVGLAHNAGWRPPPSEPVSTLPDAPQRPARCE
jgi:two-component system nitrate/nitrite response regulator NarL